MTRALGLSLLASSLIAASALGIQPRGGAAQDKYYRHPDLFVPEVTEALSALDPALAAALQAQALSLGAGEGSAFYDSRVERWSSLILHQPLIPGGGAGNTLSWDAEPRDEAQLRARVWEALKAYLREHATALRIDISELSDSPRISIERAGTLIFVHVPRVVDGVPVRDNWIGAALNGGNLILLGLQKWGDVDGPRAPAVSAQAAKDAVEAYVRPLGVAGFPKEPSLELVPMLAGGTIFYRLAWAVRCRIEGDSGGWEGLVDAGNGTLIAFEDRNQYAEIMGGVYPVSNDHRPFDGNEQAGWPMPFVDYKIGGVTRYADTGGNTECIPGSISTALNGLYMRMLDTCGTINETGSNGVDLGSGPTPSATDCTVPAGHSAGDTKSSRSGFYELNRIAEVARGHLTGASAGALWVREKLTANMNLNDTCNAFWDGSTVNFFRSSLANGCRNTGEIAAVFDHEWGHGMDNNGVNPNIAGPGEAIADIYAALRLNTSCIGRGFFTEQTCTGWGDACDGTPSTGCTGVRDIDYLHHRCDQPHTISWILNGFTSEQCGGTGSAGGCPATGSTGPCGRETHCEGMVMAEVGWDLMARDLRNPPFAYDAQTAHEMATTLLFLGAQPVGNWHTCSVGGGCSATGGYLSVLAADDDDGDLSNGTPHMTAIRAAFERHEIHCETPSLADSGCDGAPGVAPALTLAAGDRSMTVGWTGVAGAESYRVYRGEGLNACQLGKVIIAETSELSFTDTGLRNGRTYSYGVMPVGGNAACVGPMSVCVTGAPVAGPGLVVHDGAAVGGGDGDPFLDNCEAATISFSVDNLGTANLNNVRIVGVTAVTHPQSTILTVMPSPIASSLPACSTAGASFQVEAEGLTYGGVSDFLVDVTADELGGQISSRLLRIQDTESDVDPATLLRIPDSHSDDCSLPQETVAAEAVGVDAAGNGVLEVGETAAVSPTWANTGLAPVDQTGTASAFTGPAGPSYDLTDPSAVYGPFGPGTSASCTDCYAVSITAATRPATHWDASFTETVSPTAAQMSWTLHVGESFVDVPPSSLFYSAIENVLHNGVTAGCGDGTTYCPADTVTRQQMAVFLLKAKDGAGYVPPACVTEVFTDVPCSSPFAPWVNELSARGVTAGCGDGTTYCPTDPTTRQQMAVFLLKTDEGSGYAPPACVTAVFDDVPCSSPFSPWVNELAARGVTGGCGGNNYCPTAQVARQQMAVFLVKTFGLLLYGL